MSERCCVSGCAEAAVKYLDDGFALWPICREHADLTITISPLPSRTGAESEEHEAKLEDEWDSRRKGEIE